MIEKMIRHYLTAADGQTYAIGRGLGLVLFAFGLIAPSVGFALVAMKQGLTMATLVEFLSAMVPYLPALTGAVALLIWGTSSTEPREREAPQE